jgi:RimJ/RimL family protein N-acetyltransferase
VATRGVGLLVAWAFSALALSQVVAYAHPENVASQRVLERLDFERGPRLPGFRDGPGGGEDRVAFARSASVVRRAYDDHPGQ